MSILPNILYQKYFLKNFLLHSLYAMAIVFVKKNLPIFKLLFALGVNAFTLAGIIIWKWSFFVVIYFYWFEEVICIFFKLIENRIAYHKGWFPSTQAYLLAQSLTRLIKPRANKPSIAYRDTHSETNISFS